MKTSKKTFIKICILIYIIICSSNTFGQNTVTIRSNPSSAKVYQDNSYIGLTPLTLTYESGCFKFPRWAFSKHLGEPITFTISKEGYVQKTLTITKGPLKWQSLNGQNTFYYYQIKANDFSIELEPIGSFIGSNPLETKSDESPKRTVNSINDLDFSTILPAVVTISSEKSSGSGFFINSNGLIVTNKHVVEGSSSIKIVTSNGESFFSESIYTHPTIDLALIKVNIKSPGFLSIGDIKNSRIGESVYAIGSPGLPGFEETLPNSITKGIVSGFRESETFGLLIQTDVSINHGNSGGPLINNKGNVIGVNSLAFRADQATGINFAISISEVIKILVNQFNYKVSDFQNENLDNSLKQLVDEQEESILITSEPSGAEIFIDDKFISSTPSKIKISDGNHKIKVIRPEYKNWERQINKEKGNTVTINAVLEK